jgi:putative ABC transport system permease protein
MFRVSLRNLAAHKLRLVLTILAVMLGVSFVAGTFVLSDTMNKAFEDLYGRLTAGTDVQVRTELAYSDLTTQGLSRPFDESVVARVASLPDVAVAEGGVTGFALVLDREGKAIQPGGAPTIGTSIGYDKELAGEFGIREGRNPVRVGEIVLDGTTAAKGGYRLGDRVEVVLPNQTGTFTLVGIVGFGDANSLAGATLAGFDLATAQRLFDRVGLVDAVAIRGHDGVSPEELRDEVAAVLPSGLEAMTGTEVAQEGTAAIRDGLGVFTKVLLVFAAVALLVGSFVIWNTFNVLVAQRRRETALLRAVGATRRQIMGGVIIEALAIGLLSACLGLGAGVGLAIGIRNLLKVFGIEIPTTTPVVELRTVVAALAVGILVTVVAAALPALSATRVTPVEALQEGDPTTDEVGRLRRLAGLALLGGGLVGLTACAVVGDQPWLTGASALGTFIGLVLFGPSLAAMLATLADRGRRGTPRRIAARNIARSPRRAAATAMALTIGLSVVAAVAVTAESVQVSIADAVSAGNRSDLVVTPVGASLGISPAVAARLRSRSDVADVVELRGSNAQVGGHVASVAGADREGLGRALELDVRQGALKAFVPGALLVASREAAAQGLSVGDTLELTFPETGPVSLRVAGVFDQVNLITSPYVVTMEDFEAHVTSRLDSAVLLNLAPGSSLEQSEDSMAAALSDFPNVKVADAAEFTADTQASVDQLLGLVTALLLLSVIVAVLGVTNTLVLSVVERTRELGLLRAVGATRHQIAGVVRHESVLMSALGAVTGVALGTAAGVALSRALVDPGIPHLAVPAGLLATYFLVAVAVGVLAAIGPARRAGRVDLLTAVTTE